MCYNTVYIKLTFISFLSMNCSIIMFLYIPINPTIKITTLHYVCSLTNIIKILELKSYNRKQYTLLYKEVAQYEASFGRFLEYRKYYIAYVTSGVGISLICLYSPLDTAHPLACPYISGKSFLSMLHIYDL